MPFKHEVIDSDDSDDGNANLPALDEEEAGPSRKGIADDEDDEDGTGAASHPELDRISLIPPSVVPSSLRGLRACLLCALVKTAEQFEASGCDNCDRFLRLKNSRSTVLECTSSSFDGLVMLMSPAESWVAKWLRWDRGCVPGAYAVSVTGQLPTDIIEELENHGYRYQSRDTSLRA